MSLIYVPNKKNGTTYVYESTNYWDKVFLLSRSVSRQLLDIVREQVLLISCFAADSPIKYQ